MASIVPAIKSRLGDTDYYILSMKAGALAKKAIIPQKMKGWEKMKLEEIYQREIDYKRVKEHIAPYLAENKSRFFGAFIITAMNFDDKDRFESLADIVQVSRLHREAARDIGILHFRDDEVWVPLDGQHRLKAIEFAISGKDEAGANIDDFNPSDDLAKEDVCVILVPYKAAKAREIFTKVNRYAKTTKTATNIIVDDDDIIAVLTREICNEIFTVDLVNIISNTLTKNSKCFTTLTTIYNCTEAVINPKFGPVDKGRLPEKEKIRLYENTVMNFWKKITQDIEIFHSALLDKGPNGDRVRREIRKVNLLGKPVVQQVLVKAYFRLTASGQGLNHNKACRALNKIHWQISDEVDWQSVFLTKAGNMITKFAPLATRVIAYMAGEKLDAASKKKLLTDYRNLFKAAERNDIQLPQTVVD